MQWHIWVEDSENEHVYHAETWLLTKKMAREPEHRLSFTIPIFEPLPSQYYIRCACHHVKRPFVGLYMRVVSIASWSLPKDSESLLAVALAFSVLLPAPWPLHGWLLDADIRCWHSLSRKQLPAGMAPGCRAGLQGMCEVLLRLVVWGCRAEEMGCVHRAVSDSWLHAEATLPLTFKARPHPMQLPTRNATGACPHAWPLHPQHCKRLPCRPSTSGISAIRAAQGTVQAYLQRLTRPVAANSRV